MSRYLSDALLITGSSLHELAHNGDLVIIDIQQACVVLQTIIDGLVQHHGDIELNKISPTAMHQINNANTWLLGHAEESAERAERRRNEQKTIKIHKTAN